MPMTISGQRGASGVAACASVLEDFLAFDDDIARPLDGDRLGVVDRLCAVVPHMRRLVVDDVFLAVVAPLLRLVVLDDEVAVLLCVDVDLLVALLVLETDLVRALAALARIALDGRFRLLGGQWVRRVVPAIVVAAADAG